MNSIYKNKLTVNAKVTSKVLVFDQYISNGVFLIDRQYIDKFKGLSDLKRFTINGAYRQDLIPSVSKGAIYDFTHDTHSVSPMSYKHAMSNFFKVNTQNYVNTFLIETQVSIDSAKKIDCSGQDINKRIDLKSGESFRIQIDYKYSYLLKLGAIYAIKRRDSKDDIRNYAIMIKDSCNNMIALIMPLRDIEEDRINNIKAA